MSSTHPNLSTDIEIRSISDDESSDSSFAGSQILEETLQDEELMEFDDDNHVTTEEMIAEAIRGGPNINDVSMDGCTNVTIGNQTHIKGTVIIRNVLTRSVADVERRQGEICNKNERDRKSTSSSSDASSTRDDFKFHKFHKNETNTTECTLNQLYNTTRRKFIILSVLLAIILVLSGILAVILLVNSPPSDDQTTIQDPSTTPIFTESSSSSTSESTTPTTEESTEETTVQTTVETSTEESSTVTSSSTTTPLPLIIVDRDEWKKIPTKPMMRPLKVPVDEIFICHTEKLLERDFPRGCFTKEDCTKCAVKLEEIYIKDKDWDDLPYNFFLGNDNLLYEGRGWEFDGAFVTPFQGDNCLSIGFIGDYSYFRPTDNQIDILSAFIEYGIESGNISENYKVFGHCQGSTLYGTSPGKTLYEKVVTLPHWSNYSDFRKLYNCTF